MKQRIFVGVLLGMAVLIAQPARFRIPAWDGQKYQFPTLGPMFSVDQSGTLNVTAPGGSPGPQGPPGLQGPPGPAGPPGPTSILHNEILLSFDQTRGGWQVPAATAGMTIRAVMVYVNGVRYRRGVDYAIDAANFIKPLSANMDATMVVFVDYWEQ